jgi:hypothetical protein
MSGENYGPTLALLVMRRDGEMQNAYSCAFSPPTPDVWNVDPPYGIKFWNLE